MLENEKRIFLRSITKNTMSGEVTFNVVIFDTGKNVSLKSSRKICSEHDVAFFLNVAKNMLHFANPRHIECNGVKYEPGAKIGDIFNAYSPPDNRYFIAIF